MSYQSLLDIYMRKLNNKFPILSFCVVFFFSFLFSRPLPSLESPQLEFLTPTEETAVPLRQEEEIPAPEQPAGKTTESPSLIVVKRPVDLPEPLQKAGDLPEPTRQTAHLSKLTQSTKTQLSEEITKRGEPSKTAKAELSPERLPQSERQTTEVADDQTEVFKPTKKIEEISEQTENEAESQELKKNEDPQLNNKTTEFLQQERKLLEELEEKPVEVPPLVPFKVPAEKTDLTEAVQDPSAELQGDG